MPTWSASAIPYLSGKSGTEVGAREEALRLGEEVIVLEEDHITRLAILGEEVFGLEAFLVKLLIGEQLGEFEVLACVEGGVPAWTALYPCSARASSPARRASGPRFCACRARAPVGSHLRPA